MGKNLDQKFILEKQLEHFSEEKKNPEKVWHLKNINQILLKIPWGKSFNLTLVSKGNHKKMTKLLYLGAQTELSELPVYEHIRNEL